MVVTLETRVERRKKERKQNIIVYSKLVLKIIIVLMAIIMLYYGIKLVNEYIVQLGYMENASIFEFNLKEGELVLFGENYYLDLKILKRK